MESLQGYYSGLLTFLDSLSQEISSVSTSPEEQQYLTSQISRIYQMVCTQQEALLKYADRHR